jgi:membrane protein DedA with SNARE-associated domain
MQPEIQHVLAVYGYAAMLPLAVIEGPVVTVFAGFLAAEGLFDLAGVYAVAVLGDLIGDLLYYAVGRWAVGRWAVGRWASDRWMAQAVPDRHGRWAARLHQRVSVLAPQIRTRAGAMLLFGKLTHSAGFAVLLAAGAVRVDLRRFLAFNLLGALPKVLVLILVGYWFGRLYAAWQGDLRIAGVIGFVLAGSALLLGARRMLAAANERGA